jgi:hypothetical protein
MDTNRITEKALQRSSGFYAWWRSTNTREKAIVELTGVPHLVERKDTPRTRAEL